MPHIIKAWKFLVSSVHPNGMLGYVQMIGDAPENVSFEDNQSYGTGGFLLAASEMLKLAK